MNRQMTSRRRAGFTLVELLTVIVIISILVSILAPSVSKAVMLGKTMKTRALIRDLSDACVAFKSDNRYYPGQTTKTGSTHPDLVANKGSMFLAKALWSDGTATPAVAFPGTTKYCSFTADFLMADNSISDGSSNPMAILYFVSTPGVDGTAQYNVNQNSGMPGNPVMDGAFLNNVGAWPRVQDTFLLVAAGLPISDGRRGYFGPDFTANNLVNP